MFSSRVQVPGSSTSSELSLSSHTMTSAQGTNAYVGVPAFVSRLFRHAGIYIRTDRGIERPEDLAGKTGRAGPSIRLRPTSGSGVSCRTSTGVDVSDVRWRSGGLEEPGRSERAPAGSAPRKSTCSRYPVIARCRRCSRRASWTVCHRSTRAVVLCARCAGHYTAVSRCPGRGGKLLRTHRHLSDHASHRNPEKPGRGATPGWR